jgi:5-methylcytosine-specific restriction endonuclease McrA
MYVKQCCICGEYFAANPKAYIFTCTNPACREAFKHKFKSIKQTRFIEARYFDLFDTNYPLNPSEYERVCRICGARLTNNKGKYVQTYRFCKIHRDDMLYLGNFNAIADQKLVENAKQHETQIMALLTQHHLEVFDLSIFYSVCEQCGEICRKNANWSYLDDSMKRDFLDQLSAAEVHHKLPVANITIAEISLIFDPSNLIVLCKKCHVKTRKKVKIIQEQTRYKSLTSFFSKKP